LTFHVEGYTVLENTARVERHTKNYYGREPGEPWEQRWTGFKALFQKLPAAHKLEARAEKEKQAKAAEAEAQKEGTKAKAPTVVAPKGKKKPAFHYEPSGKRLTPKWADVLKQESETGDNFAKTLFSYPTWHLDSSEVDECWVYDFTNMAIPDWASINKRATGRSTKRTLQVLDRGIDTEARNTPFCPSQDKFHTVVLRGVRNISETPPVKPPMKFLL
jgi:hypothetical protein